MVGSPASADRSRELRAFVRESPLHRPLVAAAVGRAAAALPRGSRVLDAGAGSAPYRGLFAHCDYRTQDWPGSVHPDAQASDIVADLHDLPVEDGRFDFVVCTEVLEHVTEPARVLAELYRVLVPGGGLLLTVPFVVELHEEPHDHWRFTRHGLTHLLKEAGFQELSVEPLSGWFTTLAQVLRNGGLAMRPPGAPARRATRAAAFMMQALSVLLGRFAPRLDALDERRALPVGWVCRAARPA